MINDLGTGLPKKRLEGWDFVELASLVDAPDEMADLWEELGQDRTKLAANLGELKEESDRSKDFALANPAARVH